MQEVPRSPVGRGPLEPRAGVSARSPVRGGAGAETAREGAGPRAYCEGCPVQQRCYEAAMVGGEVMGIWGNTSGRTRQKAGIKTRRAA